MAEGGEVGVVALGVEGREELAGRDVTASEVAVRDGWEAVEREGGGGRRGIAAVGTLETEFARGGYK